MPTTTVIAPEDAEQLAHQMRRGFTHSQNSIPLATTSPDAEPLADNYIPGLYTLGSTYNVLNGKYADSKSALQQVIDWDKTESRSQQYAGKTYSIPKIVNFVSDTTSDYRSDYGTTVTDYTESLSVHAGFEASYPGFSASASADYSESQRENLSNVFTRITYIVTEYDLALPPLSQLPKLLKPWFVEDLDSLDPTTLYEQYGTHILCSLTIGGRASFLTTTDSRTYSSSKSVEAAAHISAQYLVASGNMHLSASEKQAMDNFNESSETSVVTRGGDPRYGNESFLPNSSEWAASVIDYPELIDFGATPCFIGIWELASTQERRNELEKAHKQYVNDYKTDLELPGPYLRARFTDDYVEPRATIYSGVDVANLQFPTNRSNDWFYISPGLTARIADRLVVYDAFPAVIASELVPGALAKVTWEKACDDASDGSQIKTRFWRAIPPTSDYVALGAVGLSAESVSSYDQPPAELVARFRAVHKSALTAALSGTDNVCTSGNNKNCTIFGVDSTYWYADTTTLDKLDCMRLDPKNVIIEDFKQFASA